MYFDESHYFGVGVTAPEILVEELVKHFGGVISAGAFAALGVEVIQNSLSFPQGIKFIVSENDLLGIDGYGFHIHFPFLSGALNGVPDFETLSGGMPIRAGLTFGITTCPVNILAVAHEHLTSRGLEVEIHHNKNFLSLRGYSLLMIKL